VELSTLDVTTVLLPFLAVKDGRALSLEVELTRARLEALASDLLVKAMVPVETALRDARLAREAITDVVMVGGSSRMPVVRRMVSEFFGKEPRGGVHPDEAVALGAAVQAGLKAGALAGMDGIVVTDVNPFTLGVEVMGLAGRQPVSGLFSPIIPRNSTVPVSRTEIYSTVRDGQEVVDIRVFQGESSHCADNVFLDGYRVEGVPRAPAGVEKVAVTFTYDLNGILHVTTRIVSTGHEARLTVAHSAQRLDPAARAAARARLDSEFGPGRPAPPASAAAPAGSPESAALLLAAARSRLSSATGAARERLLHLVGELERAVSEKRTGDAARWEREIADALLALAVEA
jgi:molecular chaperone DnaK